jgi:hypothetical protein
VGRSLRTRPRLTCRADRQQPSTPPFPPLVLRWSSGRDQGSAALVSLFGEADQRCVPFGAWLEAGGATGRQCGARQTARLRHRCEMPNLLCRNEGHRAPGRRDRLMSALSRYLVGARPSGPHYRRHSQLMAGRSGAATWVRRTCSATTRSTTNPKRATRGRCRPPHPGRTNPRTTLLWP